MNTSNITNYKPKDFAELLGIPLKLYNDETEKKLYFTFSLADCMDFVSIKN